MGNQNLIQSFRFQMKTRRLKRVELPVHSPTDGHWRQGPETDAGWLSSDPDFVYSSLFLLLQLMWPFYHLL